MAKSQPATPQLAIIGGTGLDQLEGWSLTATTQLKTPCGAPTGVPQIGKYAGIPIVFQARHGAKHLIPPHKINYRANLLALHELGVKKIIGVTAVGAITTGLKPGGLLCPHQLIDYTYGRQHSFYQGDASHEKQSANLTNMHVDFSFPFDEALRQSIKFAANQADISLSFGGTYGVTQGPRLETAAEIDRMAQAGCDIVGMTCMPEAVLARELNMSYANLSVVVNQAAGRGEGLIKMEAIKQALNLGMKDALTVLQTLIKQMAD